MDANIIAQLYEKNKMFDGKKIKFFQDPGEIKKHNYIEMMPKSEQIIFGIKKNFEFHIITNEAFYYAGSIPRGKGSIEITQPRRLALEDIFEWKIDEGVLFLNFNKVDFGTPVSKNDNIFMQAIKDILSGLFKNNDKTAKDVERKAIDVNVVRQIYRNHRLVGEKRLKYFKEPEELKLNEYSDVIQSGEHIIVVIKKSMQRYIFSDKAFYFEDKHFANKRLAYEDIMTCRSDLATGKVFINNDIIELGKPKNGEEAQIVSAMEGMVCSLIDQTICCESLPELIFDETVIVSEGMFTKFFKNGITEQDALKAAHICIKAYEDSESVLPEAPVCIHPDDRQQLTHAFMETETGEQLLFKYDLDTYGFFMTNRQFGIYQNGKENLIRLLLPQVESFSVKNILGKLYFTVNGLEKYTVEIIRPCANSCSLMFIALCAANGEARLKTLLNLAEQFNRLRMLKHTEGVLTSITAAPNKKSMIELNYGLNSLQDKNFACWMSENQLVCLNDTKLTYVKTLKNGTISPHEIENFRDTDINFVFEYADPNAGFTLGVGFGIFGAMVGSALDRNNINRTFSHCELKIGSKNHELNGMQHGDALLLRFLMAAN